MFKRSMGLKDKGPLEWRLAALSEDDITVSRRDPTVKEFRDLLRMLRGKVELPPERIADIIVRGFQLLQDADDRTLLRFMSEVNAVIPPPDRGEAKLDENEFVKAVTLFLTSLAPQP